MLVHYCNGNTKVILKPPPPCVSGPPQSFIMLPRANDDPPHHLSFSACQHHAPKPDDDPLFCIYFPWYFLRLRCANTTISLVSSTETFFSSPDDLFFMLPEAPTAERRVSRPFSLAACVSPRANDDPPHHLSFYLQEMITPPIICHS